MVGNRLTFLNDLAGAATYSLANPGPVGTLGLPRIVTIPVGDWQVYVDGIVFFSLGTNGVDPNSAGTWTPEREFAFRAVRPLTLTIALGSIGSARVNFYPHAPAGKDISQIRGPQC